MAAVSPLTSSPRLTMSDSLPTPQCPHHCRVSDSVPMAHVADVDRSTLFYSLLGFECQSRFSGHDGITNWTDLASGSARLMLARASERVDAHQQAVLFYMYSNDVRELRQHLLQHGLSNAGFPPDHEANTVCKLPTPPTSVVFEIVPRFYMPNGELRVHDPDGYVLLIGQLD